MYMRTLRVNESAQDLHFFFAFRTNHRKVSTTICQKWTTGPAKYKDKDIESYKRQKTLKSLKSLEQEWSNILINGLTIGVGDISAEDVFIVLKKRIEHEGGSYQQRILTEYLKGIETIAEEIVEVLQGRPQ
ncbi:hypothetical protein JHK86_004309 [Glycine max]|nr:hypothetical protein JHK86_004309 [Glycine max]